NPKMASDPVQDRLLDLIEAKKKLMKKPARAKTKGKEKAEPAPSNVINIMEALRKSVDAENRSGRP
ncbi:Ku protein, partial [Rhizobium phaseoli]